MSFKKFLRKNYSLSSRFGQLVKKELQMKVNLPLGTKLKMWTNGFWSVSYFRYDFKKYRMKDYISDYQDNIRWSFLDTLDSIELDIYFDNKLLFQKCIESNVNTPKHYCLIINKQVIPLEPGFPVNASGILDFIRQHDIMMKPLGGMWGYGIFLISYDGTEFSIDGKITSPKALEEFILSKANYAICLRVKQSAITGQFYNRTLNTIRVLTIISEKNNEPFIAGAVQRIGTGNSFPVDNFHRGGIAANIDLISGEYGPAASIFPVKEGLNWFEKHPETNVPIKGFVNPKWQQISTTILDLAKKMSFHKIIAWDVAIDINDTVTIIEGNTGADPKIHQIHKPLLLDERVRSFCKHYKII